MAYRARTVFGSFEKRTPSLGWLVGNYCYVTVVRHVGGYFCDH